MGGSEFPFSECFDGVFIEDGIERADDLDAIHGTVFANDAEQDDFAFDARFHLFGRITWIGFMNGHGAGKGAGGSGSARSGVG